jgi:hypothetical protein
LGSFPFALVDGLLTLLHTYLIGGSAGRGKVEGGKYFVLAAKGNFIETDGVNWILNIALNGIGILFAAIFIFSLPYVVFKYLLPWVRSQNRQE